ncbi:recombination protein O N-terminal domain-containing protein, partial [Pelagibacteraceae bacterium]|nr:recombination protein O N-terminal domain-containing protein [Pelagibacteraceae bacterium]
MLWTDEGYLLSKSNFDENSIIIDAFTLKHGKYTGIVYGGSSRKQKRNFQLGNKILLNWKSKNENKSGYFSIELIKPVAPLFFDNKRKTACILSAVSILKILLPERQI